VASRSHPPLDPDVGIPDLVRRLTDDSKRLVGDEVRLAKLEVQESIRTATRGVMWLAVAAVCGRAELLGNWWAGAIVVGVVEVVLGALLLRTGIAGYREPAYTLPETRRALAGTARWARRPTAGA
jgi:hypothetical protein